MQTHDASAAIKPVPRSPPQIKGYGVRVDVLINGVMQAAARSRRPAAACSRRAQPQGAGSKLPGAAAEADTVVSTSS